jgi:hypothetical protein
MGRLRFGKVRSRKPRPGPDPDLRSVPGPRPGGSEHVETFGNLLEERKDTIVERWVDAVLSVYPSDAAAIFQSQQDPFANPLGHSVREGTRGVFQTILNGMDQDDLREHLDQIVRIRAVQQLTPSQALSFIFTLRSIVREVIPESETDSGLRKGLSELDKKIDEVALTAFELYASRREEVSELRVNEVKRQVAWVMGKMNRQDAGPEEVLEDSSQKTSRYENVQREDL